MPILSLFLVLFKKPLTKKVLFHHYFFSKSRQKSVKEHYFKKSLETLATFNPGLETLETQKKLTLSMFSVLNALSFQVSKNFQSKPLRGEEQ